MKTLRFLLLSLLSLAFVACENGENNALPPKPVDGEYYTGTLTVDQNDGTVYTQENVQIDYEILDGKLNFVMYKVKFANGMPIKLDMVVEGVDCIGAAGHYVLTGDNIIPYAMGGPFEQFTITKLTGLITDDTMTLSFMCGEYPVTYSGTK